VKKPSESDAETIALNDGKNRIVLDTSGHLIGLESLPRDTQSAVKETLTAKTIKKPIIIDELEVAGVSLRAPSGSEEQVKLIYPVNGVIEEDRPRFEWVPASGATAYQIEIGDSSFHQVDRSEALPSTTSTWTPPAPLKRGVIYTWLIRATDGEGKFSSAQGKFQTLTVEKMNELIRLRTKTKSHLALGVFYAREGMLEEAEREFQILTRDNPYAPIAVRLLQQVRTWRRR
jgi:hypothetical protein